MFRAFHRWAGVSASLLLVIVALTGAILSIFPVFSADRTAARLNAGDLVVAVQQAIPGAEQIVVDDNGIMSAVSFGANGLEQTLVDPATGAAMGAVQSSQLELWFENLHRALFLSDIGHVVVLIVTLAMVILSISGYFLAARRMGGWRKLFTRDRGEGAGGLHLKIARIAGIGLLISSISGVWMGASTLGLIPETSPYPEWPSAISTEAALPADQLAALTAIDGDTIRQITIPRAGIPGQAYMVETDAGAGYVDPATGEMLTWDQRSLWSKVMDVMHLLHTGQGASILGLVLGLMSLAVPVLTGSGLLVWIAGRSRGPKLHNTDAAHADVVLLVGSETGTTGRFARAAALWLQGQGQTTHIADMNDFAPETYAAAQSIILCAATYGEGDAPHSASDFCEAIANARPLLTPISIVGFGDTSYPEFCGYARKVAQTLRERGWTVPSDIHTVDRQSVQDFAAWGRDYAAAFGLPEPDLATMVDPQPTTDLTLISKLTYGEEDQAPMAVLRFALPKRSVLDRLMRRGFAGFEAGDLLNILPQGDPSPRSYSLASASKDGFVEICVRKAPGGLCSGQLYALEVGETVHAYVSTNVAFHAPKGDAPLVLIGAGAGVGALAGFIRANAAHRPVHMYFGVRSRRGGYAYDDDFAAWETDGRLSSLTLALSRGTKPRYVQNAVADDAVRIADLINTGAQILICGGRDMGDGVKAVLDDILTPLGLSVDALKAEGRYAADVF